MPKVTNGLSITCSDDFFPMPKVTNGLFTPARHYGILSVIILITFNGGECWLC